MASVVCLGEVMVELSAGPDLSAPRIGFAGDTFNTAIYLKRAAPGIEVAYATKIGRDVFSDGIRALMRHEEINERLVMTSEDRLPGLYAIATDSAGERRFLYWREMSACRTLFQPLALAFSAFEGTDVMYFSAISIAVLPPEDRDRFLDWLAGFRGTVAFDSNYRPGLWPDRETAAHEIARAWRAADIGLPSLDDEMALYGDASEDAVIARLNGWGVTRGALKRGRSGPRPLSGGPAGPFPPAPKVVDSTAAGDSFNAAYLAALLSGATEEKALEAGHALAAEVVQHRGAILPRREDRR